MPIRSVNKEFLKWLRLYGVMLEGQLLCPYKLCRVIETVYKEMHG